MTRPRVVVIGFGDTGVLTATRLSRSVDVVGIATAPELVSGQELGLRLTDPDLWARDYRVAYDRFRRLDGVRVVHGEATGVDFAEQRVDVREADGTHRRERYDALVIATGVGNGFWRWGDVVGADVVDARLAAPRERLVRAASIAVVGGGAAAVASATQFATRWPHTQVDLFFPGAAALPQHHRRVWARVQRRLVRLGVGVHPGHRAVLGADLPVDEVTDRPIRWASGQADTHADAVLWAVGKVRPHTGFLPAEVLDQGGFVRVDADLRVSGQPRVIAVGDVAASDPLRSTARNRGHLVAAANVMAILDGRATRPFRPPARRWGSVVGRLPDGFEVFAPNGSAFWLPNVVAERLIWPWVVSRGIYGGIRREDLNDSRIGG